jgi:hypothetical protein
MRNEKGFFERITPRKVVKAIGGVGLALVSTFSIGRFMAYELEHTRAVEINTMASSETHTTPTTVPDSQVDQLTSDINAYDDMASVELLEAGAALVAAAGVGMLLTKKDEMPPSLPQSPSGPQPQ